jgi:serine/threonine protein kinase/tetratricopeptide (TPR) repeat protein
MTKERWQLVERIYHAALERDGEARDAFLAQACAGDDDLHREVEGLIGHDDQDASFIESPAIDVAARILAEDRVNQMEGRRLGSYKILSRLGAGGMGEVYLGEDTSLGRRVAIKFLSPQSTGDEHARRRLIREAQAAASLDHPNICAIYETREQEGESFIVMQYVEGETLAERIKSKPLELRESLDIGVQVADALAEAHSRGIIHRDIKPQNIMITRRGQAKLMDFGLARVIRERSLIDCTAEPESVLSVPGLVIGTVPYMSPEQVRGEELDARSDVFSLGAVLYEMLSGRNPFQAESAGATMSSILTKEPAPLARYASDVPDEMQRIVRKALSKDKESRYQGITDLLIDLRELRQDLDFEAKLDRSTGLEFRERATNEGNSGAGRAEAGTPSQQVARTGETLTGRTTSSTRIIIGEIRQHRLGVSLTVAVIVVAAIAAYFYFNRQPALTDKDTILLADFVNTTGDAAFDGALKMALAVQLEQSPFLNLFSDERVRETMRYMERSPDERVTKEVGREICERQGIKALLAGSVSNLGSHYVIALEAINAHTGDVLAREQAEAESKEQVLSVLGKTATRLREKLGESLLTIQKFDVPIDQTTTSSLEALKAYSAGIELGRKRRFLEAHSFLKRAVELDPNFVGAYAGLAVNSSNLGEKEAGRQYATKAFLLRGRASERERLGIESGYYHLAKGELENAIEALELLRQTYPRDNSVHVNLGYLNGQLGNYERALEESSEALRLSPTVLNTHLNVAHVLITLGRYDEATEVLERAQAQKLGLAAQFHFVLYRIAFHLGDAAAMRSDLEHLRVSPRPWFFLHISAVSAEANGQLRKDREMTGQVAEFFKQQNQRGRAADETARNAEADALYGHCELARKDAASALAIGRTPESLQGAALAFALCGDLGQAQSLADESARLTPTDTLANTIWLPVIRAAIAIQRGNHPRALELLQPARRYDRADRLSAHYLRGLAYLGQRSGVQAEAEFQFILDHRGLDTYSPFYPLARLGLARAHVVSSGNEKARKTYEDFFAHWKDADSDLPILIQAKKEYDRLK